MWEVLSVPATGQLLQVPVWLCSVGRSSQSWWEGIVRVLPLRTALSRTVPSYQHSQSVKTCLSLGPPHGFLMALVAHATGRQLSRSCGIM